MPSHLYSHAVLGVDAYKVDVEADSLGGNFSVQVVGLPDNAVRESRERIQSAIKNAGFSLPTQGVRYVINLGPADIRKEGAALDLPMAVALLGAIGEVDSARLSRYSLVGELALDGRLKPVRGMICMAEGARADGFKGLLVPPENADEAALIPGIDILPVRDLREAVDFLNGPQKKKKANSAASSPENNGPATSPEDDPSHIAPHRVAIADLIEEARHGGRDMQDVVGQESAKRALEIVASGGHNVLLIGPPGSGKTLLLQRLGTILPPLSIEEALETTKIHSMAGELETGRAVQADRPFRSPHHTVSHVALVGGGAYPRPGEISLAHHGVLFLDEMPEFPRNVLEALRQPLEDGVVTIARAQLTVRFPARFILAGAMNPCPCGYQGHFRRECSCRDDQVQRYRAKLSGPLLDRIDLHVEVGAVKVEELRGEGRTGEPSANIRARVERARLLQQRRYAGEAEVFCNAHLPPRLIRKYCVPDEEARALLDRAMDQLGLSARAHDRILRAARTIADLEHTSNSNHPDTEVDAGSSNTPSSETPTPPITSAHISEAISYRTLDR